MGNDILKIIGQSGIYSDVELKELPVDENEIKISGSLKQWEKIVFEGEQLIGLIWKSEYGVMRDVDYPFDQVVVVLEGTLVLTPDDGEVQSYKKGDVFLYPKGFTGLWEMPTDYKELIIIEKKAFDNTL